MESPEPPAPAVVEMSDGEEFRGTLVEEQPDGWLLEEENGRLIHVYSQKITEIVCYEDFEERGLPPSGTIDTGVGRGRDTIRYRLNRLLR